MNRKKGNFISSNPVFFLSPYVSWPIFLRKTLPAQNAAHAPQSVPHKLSFPYYRLQLCEAGARFRDGLYRRDDPGGAGGEAAKASITSQQEAAEPAPRAGEHLHRAGRNPGGRHQARQHR